MANWSAAHGNMLRAKDLGLKLTPTQMAINIMGSDIKDYLKDKADGDAMVYKISTPGPHFLEDFKKASMLHMKGRTWNPHVRVIDSPELKDVLWGEVLMQVHTGSARCASSDGKRRGKALSFMH